jgi:hypothetical protein
MKNRTLTLLTALLLATPTSAAEFLIVENSVQIKQHGFLRRPAFPNDAAELPPGLGLAPPPTFWISIVLRSQLCSWSIALLSARWAPLKWAANMRGYSVGGPGRTRMGLAMTTRISVACLIIYAAFLWPGPAYSQRCPAGLTRF